MSWHGKAWIPERHPLRPFNEKTNIIVTRSLKGGLYRWVTLEDGRKVLLGSRDHVAAAVSRAGSIRQTAPLVAGANPPPANMPGVEGIYMGGCIVGNKFTSGVLAHAHNRRNPAGWICFRSPDPALVFDADGRPTYFLMHEYAHIVAGTGGHNPAWRDAMGQFGQPTAATVGPGHAAYGLGHAAYGMLGKAGVISFDWCGSR